MPIEPLLFFQICAGIGSGVLVLQLLLQLFGGGDVDDFDVDGGDLDVGDHDFQWLSLRTITSFLAIFGLVGWWGTAEEWGSPRTLGSAVAAGLATMLVVAYLLSLQRKLASQGNVKAENVVGLVARVYLKIPSERSGMGKITVLVQERSMEYGAQTAGAELPTGAQVRVVRMLTANTFEVEALD
ncbi:MAG: hypothetical protein KDC14_06740 [Planctomycetes bacterium]|nr:hypothetical protein [Planctomycetota bacterium]